MVNGTVSSPCLSVWTLLGCLLAGGLLSACAEAEGQAPPISAAKIQSVTLDARRATSPAVMIGLRNLGVTHVTLIQFGFQPGPQVPQIRMHTDADWFSESDRGIRILAREADSLGLGLILKPHIWVGGYSTEGQTRHAIGFETDEAWATWESQYHTFMMHYAHLAEEVEAGVLVVGTELAQVARTRPAFWRTLITDVRAVYSGSLTYAANWYEEYEHIPFWDALDYIGVQAYFELSKEDHPTAAMLHAGWTPHKEALQRLSEKTGRPILFTEIGYRNVPYAAAQPWRWPSRDEVGAVSPDDALQRRLYQAFFENLWHEPWFAGAILWKWHPDDSRRRRTLGFSPQNKPAEQLIGTWFSQGRPLQPGQAPR